MREFHPTVSADGHLPRETQANITGRRESATTSTTLQAPLAVALSDNEARGFFGRSGA